MQFIDAVMLINYLLSLKSQFTIMFRQKIKNALKKIFYIEYMTMI